MCVSKFLESVRRTQKGVAGCGACITRVKEPDKDEMRYEPSPGLSYHDVLMNLATVASPSSWFALVGSFVAGLAAGSLGAQPGPFSHPTLIASLGLQRGHVLTSGTIGPSGYLLVIVDDSFSSVPSDSLIESLVSTLRSR